jgi:hypothetical protein
VRLFNDKTADNANDRSTYEHLPKEKNRELPQLLQTINTPSSGSSKSRLGMCRHSEPKTKGFLMMIILAPPRLDMPSMPSKVVILAEPEENSIIDYRLTNDLPEV